MAAAVEDHNGENPRQSDRRAYVTLVMMGDRYSIGACVLAYSLLKHSPDHDRVCMVTPDVSEDAKDNLRGVFDRVVEVDYIRDNYVGRLRNRKIEGIYGKWKNVSLTKWRILELTQYSKVIFMDADTIAVGNIGDLFELPTPAATFSLSQAHPYTKKGLSNPYASLRHGEVVSKKMIEKGLSLFVCIGTTVVLTPSVDDFQKYVSSLKVFRREGYSKCINGPDEQSICRFYNEIKKERFTHIDQSYNMIPWKESTWGCGKQSYVLHYPSKVKPWEMLEGEWEDLKSWFDMKREMEDYLKSRKRVNRIRDYFFTLAI